MDAVTKIMLTTLEALQLQLNETCARMNPQCATDRRYAPEWINLRDYVDREISNIQAADAYGYSDETLRATITQVSGEAAISSNALLEGYILDLAQCQEEDGSVCPRAARAREALEARRLLRDRMGKP